VKKNLKYQWITCTMHVLSFYLIYYRLYLCRFSKIKWNRWKMNIYREYKSRWNVINVHWIHLEEYTSICRLKSNEDYLPCINGFSGLFLFVLCTLCCQFLWIVSLRLVYPMLSVSLDCPIWLSASVFSNVYAFPTSGILYL
jgi:hypothetical protein